MFDFVSTLSPDLYFKFMVLITIIIEAVGLAFFISRSRKKIQLK